MTYNFTIKANRIGIDPVAGYGYWDRADGSEGGGLWFDTLACGALLLIDYDGVAGLPWTILEGLKALGVAVEEEFY